MCLPSMPDSDYANVSAIVTGWGHLAENVPEELMEGDVKTTTNTECIKAYQDVPGEISDDMICAANPGKSSCQGDSGGDY